MTMQVKRSQNIAHDAILIIMQKFTNLHCDCFTFLHNSQISVREYLVKAKH